MRLFFEFRDVHQNVEDEKNASAFSELQQVPQKAVVRLLPNRKLKKTGPVKPRCPMPESAVV
jgi:hypothetical protein